MASEPGWRDLEAPNRPRRTSDTSPFVRLARTHALAMAGDALVTTALAGSLFFSISPHAARGRVLLSLVLTMAPFAVVAPFLGPAIDRSRAGKRLMIVIATGGRGVACMAMARVIDSLLLFPAAFAVLVLSKAYSVSKSALVPAATESDEVLVEANAKLAIIGVLAGFAAAGPGILLVRFAGAEWAAGAAGGVFTLAAFTAVQLPAAGRASAAPAASRAGTGATGVAASDALHLTVAAVAAALLRAVVGFLTFLVAFGFRRAGAPAWQFGVVLAASMAAALAGAALAPALRSRFREEVVLAGALAATGVAGVAIARLSGTMWAAVVAAIVGLAAAVAKLAFDAIVQRDTHDLARGRSFARFEAGFQLVWVVGAVLPVAVATPIRQGFDVIGIAGLAGAGAFTLASRQLGRSTG